MPSDAEERKGAGLMVHGSDPENQCLPRRGTLDRAPFLPREPFQRLVDLRQGACEVCGKLVSFESILPLDSDKPEFVKTRLSWLGWRLDDDLGTVTLLVACSDRCVQAIADGTEGGTGDGEEVRHVG